MNSQDRIKSVAIIGAGAAGAITAAAFKAENYYDRIRVFERRESPGGTWIYDPQAKQEPVITPGGLPPDIDPKLAVPSTLPRITSPNQQERFAQTPIYASLTTNVPDIAMCFSDERFAYGPFVPHYIPRQYIGNYFSKHKLDDLLILNTTLEDLSKIPPSSSSSNERWKLTLRKFDCFRHADVWWEEEYDAVILANGHYSVPFVSRTGAFLGYLTDDVQIPEVKGLQAFMEKFPGQVMHSKYYRSPTPYTSQKVLVIGNSASGHDITNELVSTAHHPVYQSRRSKSRWDGPEPPQGIAWKPVISEYLPSGRIIFEDGTYLDDIDKVIYCTGYKASFPFWNEKANGRPMWDYESNKIINGYWHTFLQDFKTLAIVGLPRVLTFRSFEYQAIALARLFSGRNGEPLPSLDVMKKWVEDTEKQHKKEHRKFHDVEWTTGETREWLQMFFAMSGLGTLDGDGRIPPVLGKEMVWAIEHLRKYPEPGKDDAVHETNKERGCKDSEDDKGDWEIVDRWE